MNRSPRRWANASLWAVMRPDITIILCARGCHASKARCILSSVVVADDVARGSCREEASIQSGGWHLPCGHLPCEPTERNTSGRL